MFGRKNKGLVINTEKMKGIRYVVSFLLSEIQFTYVIIGYLKSLYFNDVFNENISR